MPPRTGARNRWRARPLRPAIDHVEHRHSEPSAADDSEDRRGYGERGRTDGSAGDHQPAAGDHAQRGDRDEPQGPDPSHEDARDQGHDEVDDRRERTGDESDLPQRHSEIQQGEVVQAGEGEHGREVQAQDQDARRQEAQAFERGCHALRLSGIAAEPDFRVAQHRQQAEKVEAGDAQHGGLPADRVVVPDQ